MRGADDPNKNAKEERKKERKNQLGEYLTKTFREHDNGAVMQTMSHSMDRKKSTSLKNVHDSFFSNGKKRCP